MAQKDNLETALLEAYLLLNEGHEKVLVVVAETPLYETYNVRQFKNPPFAYALAMIVESGDQYKLSLNQGVNLENVDNALIWVKNQHLNQTQWQTASSAGGYWLWQKN